MWQCSNWTSGLFWPNMGATMRRRCFLSFSLACAAILFSCSQDQAAPIPAKRQQAQAPAQELSLPKAPLSASCIFVEGYVERGRKGSWQELEIGDSIEAQDSVRTGPDGSCEIQFGGSAMLRIQPSTLYMLDSVALSAELNRVEGSLAIGTVLNKVNKLSGKDSYMVRTDTSVAGVRGTDFMVSNDSVRGTTVSVKAGAVAVLPVSPVVYELLAASSTNAAAAAAVEAIVSSARIVAANQEITVDKAAAEEARIVHQEIAQEIAAISPEALEALAKSLPEAAGSAAQVAAPSSLAAAPLITAGNATFTGSTLSVAILAEKAEASDNASLKAAYASLKRIADTAAARIDTPAPVSIPSQSPVLESFKLIDTMQPAAAVPVREESKVAPADPVSLIAPSTGAPAASAAAPASATGAKAPAATSAPAVPGPAVPAMGQPASGSQQSPAVAATAQVQAPKREFIISSWDVLKNPVAGNVVRMPAGDVFVLSDPRGNLSAVSPTGKLLWSMEIGRASCRERV